MELYWAESCDVRGFDTWLRCLSISHWGLVVTEELPRWFYPTGWRDGLSPLSVLVT